MKILTALTYYYPHWTGLTAFAVRLAEGLAGRGHQVTVVTSRYRSDLPADEVHNGVRIVRVRPILRVSRGQVMPSFLPAVGRLIREHDIVQVHTPMLETAAVAYLAHRAGRKLLMTHHGDLVMPNGAWNQFVEGTVGYLLRKGGEQADLISIYTRDYAEHSAFLRSFGDKVVPVYPPFSFPRANPEAAVAWRRELGLDGAKVVGFAGRWVEEKGFDYLLEAIPLVRERHPRTVFVYAGETRVVYERFYERCRPLLEAYGQHVIQLGLITDSQRMADYYAMCDVFALPSRTDCLASVQVESMLCGTPVVSTDIPGAREVVKVTGMGLLVPPGDAHALAAGLAQVLDDPALYQRSYAHISGIFDTAKSIRDYEALFARLVGA